MASSMLMQGSRIRELPPISTEDLRSRLTENEINNIKRWAEGRNVTSLVIVKKIPFAVFIFMDLVGYLHFVALQKWPFVGDSL